VFVGMRRWIHPCPGCDYGRGIGCLLSQSADVAQLCGSILVNVTKIKYTDGFRRILQAGVVNRLVVYCRASSKELVQLQSCVAALGNLADAFDISDVLLLEGMGPVGVCTPLPPR
jgi:hypothetical protein